MLVSCYTEHKKITHDAHQQGTQDAHERRTPEVRAPPPSAPAAPILSLQLLVAYAHGCALVCAGNR